MQNLRDLAGPVRTEKGGSRNAAAFVDNASLPLRSPPPLLREIILIDDYRYGIIPYYWLYSKFLRYFGVTMAFLLFSTATCLTFKRL